MKQPPDFVYRLASSEEWFVTQETGVAPGREIDHADGYMHLSTRDQALETADIHFADAEDLLALEIPFAPLASQIRFELAPKRGEEFPHLYGALRRRHVARAIRLVKGANGFDFGDEV